jgi:hypothetical protein
MPIDWDKIQKDLEEIVDSGARRADDRLASKISSYTRMTDAEVKELFPEPADALRLGQLMKVVKAAEDRNTKINTIVGNAEKFAGAIVTLLERFV